MQTRRHCCAQHGDSAVDICGRRRTRTCLPALMPSTGCAQEKVWPGEPVHNGRELSTLGISRATSHVSFRPPFLQVPPSGQTARPARHMRRGRDAARADRLRQTVRARRDRANRRPRARRPGHGDRANRRARARRPGAPRPREQSAPGTATRARRPGHGDPGRGQEARGGETPFDRRTTLGFSKIRPCVRPQADRLPGSAALSRSWQAARKARAPRRDRAAGAAVPRG